MTQFISERLNKRPGIWRVDGVAGVTNRGHSGNSCYVHFSQIDDTKIKAPYEPNARTTYSATLSCHVATLTEFRVGTIWKEGKLYANAEQVPGTFTLDVAKCRYAQLGDSIDLSGMKVQSFLDEKQMRYGALREQLARAFYAIVPVIGSVRVKWLITPASELLRFYYGPSSRVLSSIVRGSLDEFISFDESRSYLAGNEAVLFNHCRLTRLEAMLFARLIASPYALHEARHIHQHISTKNANRWHSHNFDEDIRPTLLARFPFRDLTSLAVLGKEIFVSGINEEKKHVSQRAVYAMQIVKCSHSLGYSKIIQRTEETVPKSPVTGDGGRRNPSPLEPKFDPENPPQVVEEQPNAKIRRLVTRSAENPFSAYSEITFSFLKDGDGLPSKKPSSLGSKEEIEINALSMGDGSNAGAASNIGGLDSYQYLISHEGRDIGVFLDMLKHLQDLEEARGWHIRLTGLSQPIIVAGTVLTSFPQYIGPKRSWHLTQDGAIQRPRHIAVAEITLPNQGICYLLEMELGAGKGAQCTLLLHSPEFSIIPDKQFDLLFRLTAMQNRWIGPNNKWGPKQGAEEQKAKEFFSLYVAHPIYHPHVEKLTDVNKSSRSINPLHWAKSLVRVLHEKMGIAEAEAA